jgi:hypothetical protein
MKATRFVVSAIALVLLTLGANAQSDNPAEQQPSGKHDGHEQHQLMQMMIQHCEVITAEHQELMKHIKTSNAELDGLMTEMMASSGMKKVDALAAVVAEMFAQQKLMQARVMSMQPRMMNHTMTHMDMAMDTGMRKPMEMCPMRKEMEIGSGQPILSTDEDHSAHHPEK